MDGNMFKIGGFSIEKLRENAEKMKENALENVRKMVEKLEEEGSEDPVKMKILEDIRSQIE